MREDLPQSAPSFLGSTREERFALLLRSTEAMVAAPLDRQALTATIFAQVGPYLGADVCFNYELRGHTLHLVAGHGIPSELWAASQCLEEGCAFCGTVAQTKQPLRADAARIQMDAKGSFVRGMGVTAYMCHPLRGRSGNLLGTLSFASRTRTSFAPEETEFLQTLCQYLALAWERMAVEEASRENAARLRQVTDSIQEVVWLWDAASRTFIYVSPAYARIWGRSCLEVYTEPTLWHAGVDDAKRTELEALRTPISERGFDVEFQIQRPDGTMRWVRDRALPVEGGRIAGVAEDVTERKEAEAARERLESQLRQSQKMEALGALAGGIAHDFNNLLLVILGNAELARMDADEPGRVEGYLKGIGQAGTRARELVQRILAFSRPQPPRRAQVRLEDLVKEVISFLRPTIPAGVELRLQTDGATPWVAADAAQVHQVLLNLATNAWHALEGKPGLIEFSVAGFRVDQMLARAHPGLQPGPHVLLTVRDTGKGMEPSVLERIFEPFFTTKGPGVGTGLGLSVVHGILRSHGGTLYAESTPGKGSVFYLYFPAERDADRVPDSAKVASVAPTGAHERLLYIDDEPSLVSVCTRLLESRGYDVKGFTDPAEAVAYFQEDPARVDLVITDFNMPHLSGLEVARRLVADRPDLPIVLVSGYISEEMEGRAREAGVSQLLYKPNTVEEIGSIIPALLKRRVTPRLPA